MSLPTIVIGLDRKVRTASAVIAIHVGSQDEFAGTFGLAHVLEHMMFRGTTKRPLKWTFYYLFFIRGPSSMVKQVEIEPCTMSQVYRTNF